MKLDISHPESMHLSIVDSKGQKVSGAFSYDTVTGNLGVWLLSREGTKTTVAVDAKGQGIKLYKKVKGLKVIDRRTGKEYVGK